MLRGRPLWVTSGPASIAASVKAGNSAGIEAVGRDPGLLYLDELRMFCRTEDPLLGALDRHRKRAESRRIAGREGKDILQDAVWIMRLMVNSVDDALKRIALSSVGISSLG